jgi:hypothetical protein
MFNKTTSALLFESRGGFVEQKLMLSSIFSCDQINQCQKYDLSQTWMFNKSNSALLSESRVGFVEQKLMLSNIFRCDQSNKCKRCDLSQT